MRKRRIRPIFIPLIAIAIGIVIYILYTNKDTTNTKVEEPKVIDEIKEYGYKLKENKSDYYKDLFNNLGEVLSKEDIDEEKYAKLIAQLFIVDFYTLDDKVTKNDVGGTEFIYSTYKDNFMEKASDTIYKYIENNIYGDRKQTLPIVTGVDVLSIKNMEFTYLDSKKDPKAYEVSLSWEYKKDLGYESSTKLIIVHENNKLAIVQMD